MNLDQNALCFKLLKCCILKALPTFETFSANVPVASEFRTPKPKIYGSHLNARDRESGQSCASQGLLKVLLHDSP